MAHVLDDTYKEKFEKITKSNFVAQAKWYLNAFWEHHGKEKADEIYSLTVRMTKHTKRGAEGCDLDELEAHKFIESLGETLTVIELRDRLRSIDINNDKRMALTEYFLFKFPEGSIKTLCESVQSEDDPEMKEAQRLVAEANAALQKALDEAEQARQRRNESDARAREAKAAEENAKRLEDEAKGKEAQAKADFDVADGKRQDADAKAAVAKKAKEDCEAVEEELKAALAELKKQEDDHAAKIKELESIAGTPGVKGGQAAAELLKLKNENPLPLRKAQAEQGVVIKKAEKARAAATATHDVAAAAAAEAQAAADTAEASKNAATAARQSAEAATEEARQATAAAEAAAAAAAAAAAEAEEAANAAATAVDAANAVVEELKKKCVLHGSIWFMEKEMQEAAKFMPKGKK